MSTLIVEATRIKEIKKHPNADKLELAVIKGWQIVVAKGSLKAGDSVVFVPPNSMIPQDLAEKLGVWKYLSVKKDATVGRVRAAKLRQETSFGFVFANTENLPEGKDLKEHFGITKYEPPPENKDGEAERDCPLFHKYTDIENIRNFPDIFQEGEEVIVTEKIHGKNTRLAYILADEGSPWQIVRWLHKAKDAVAAFFGRPNPHRTEQGLWTYMIGSHEIRRRLGKGSVFELPLTDGMKVFLRHLTRRPDLAGFDEKVFSVVLFGETFGYGVQDLQYGLKKIHFRIFDIAINGKYVDADKLDELAKMSGSETVPVLYRGPYSYNKMKELANGTTTLMESDAHMREGIVIKPAKERRHGDIGRVVLKFISDEYELRDGGTEHH